MNEKSKTLVKIKLHPCNHAVGFCSGRCEVEKVKGSGNFYDYEILPNGSIKLLGFVKSVKVSGTVKL